MKSFLAYFLSVFSACHEYSILLCMNKNCHKIFEPIETHQNSYKMYIYDYVRIRMNKRKPGDSKTKRKHSFVI